MAPTSQLFNRIKNLYSKDADDLPVINISTAVILSVVYTLLYVIPLYFSPATRPSPSLSRDAPSVIRARIRAVTFSCVVCALTSFYAIMSWNKSNAREALRLLGLWPIAPVAVAKILCLTAILFTGPLFERGVVEGGWKDWIRGARVAETLRSWMGWRNFVAGPITEELVFRSTLISLHLLAKVSPAHIVLYTPLYFGIAHIHHFYEFTLTHPHTPLLPALLRSLFQFSYTTIFGWYASFIYLRTGSLYACIVAHSFCNWCGFPRLWGKVEVEAGVPIGPPDLTGKKEDEALNVQVSDGRLSIWWTVAYYTFLFAGAIGFKKEFWLLTMSKSALAIF
ncbi:MAG: hypothetical protein M1834_000205 [Cirrosporium novae-zelandiae]|nr:MAG: hypothetical protein M1834_000205 [Cirrosporium novae-zelandiae]